MAFACASPALGADDALLSDRPGRSKTGPTGRATLLMSVNGTTKTVEFSANTDRSFVETLDYAAASVAELRLTFVLLAECDAGGKKPKTD